MTQTLSQTVASRVRQLRDARGWSGARLAERCRELGLEMQRDVVANIENGRRSTVTIEELAGLALALDTSPVILLLPLGDEEAVAITPTTTMHPHLALEWFAGEDYAQFFHVDEPYDGERLPHGQDRGAWLGSARPLLYFRRLRPLQDRVEKGEVAVKQAAFEKDDDAEREARRGYADALREFAGLRDEMQSAGMSTPELHPDTVEDMKALGIEVR